MIFELSRDYGKAWEWIQDCERLDCRYETTADIEVCKCGMIEGEKETSVIVLYSQQVVICDLSTVFDLFVERCTALNIEFYLPLADNTIVVSEERLRELVGECADEALAPFDDLTKTIEKNIC
jgi:hypothetical protein